jgi:hypothetical protein
VATDTRIAQNGIAIPSENTSSGIRKTIKMSVQFSISETVASRPAPLVRFQELMSLTASSLKDLFARPQRDQLDAIRAQREHFDARHRIDRLQR